MPADYHSHTPLCQHAEGTPEEYVRAAIAAGITEYGIADHAPVGTEPFDDWRMPSEKLPEYLDWIECAKSTAGSEIPVRAGLECDWLPNCEPWIEQLKNNSSSFSSTPLCATPLRSASKDISITPNITNKSKMDLLESENEWLWSVMIPGLLQQLQEVSPPATSQQPGMESIVESPSSVTSPSPRLASSSGNALVTQEVQRADTLQDAPTHHQERHGSRNNDTTAGSLPRIRRKIPTLPLLVASKDSTARTAVVRISATTPRSSDSSVCIIIVIITTNLGALERFTRSRLHGLFALSMWMGLLGE